MVVLEGGGGIGGGHAYNHRYRRVEVGPVTERTGTTRKSMVNVFLGNKNMQRMC